MRKRMDAGQCKRACYSLNTPCLGLALTLSTRVPGTLRRLTQVLEVLPSEAARDCVVSVNYEALVTSPEAELQAVCKCLDVPFEAQMLAPYEAQSTKYFRQVETVFLGDPKLFKKAHIDAKQADKWKKITTPRSLRSATMVLAQQLGYHEFPLWLPPELTWLKPPKLHSSTPPADLLLCLHGGTGVVDILRELVSHIRTPSVGLRPTSRSLRGCNTMALLEQRYWDLTERLWSSSSRDCRRVLGHSFGCRIAFAFAARFDKAGCLYVRVVLLDGRVASQCLAAPVANDDAGRAFLDATRAKLGDELYKDMLKLNQLRVDGAPAHVPTWQTHLTCALRFVSLVLRLAAWRPIRASANTLPCEYAS